jgi:hypothetical protein
MLATYKVLKLRQGASWPKLFFFRPQAEII